MENEIHGDDDWSQSFTDQVLLSVAEVEAALLPSTPSNSANRIKHIPPNGGAAGAGANHLAPTSILPLPPFSIAPCQYNVINSSDVWSSVHTPSHSPSSHPPCQDEEDKWTPWPDPQPRGSYSRVLPSSILAAPSPSATAPWKDDSRMRYPPLRFSGNIVYSRTVFEVEKAALELSQILEAKKKEVGIVAIGFDIEWKPSFIAGDLPGKAAVVQICFDRSYCHVMHIIHSGIPSSLESLLEDPSLLKVGVGINGDRVKMYEDHKICLESLEDLSCLANQKLGGVPRQWSLKALTEMLVSKELPKPKKIRLGNWEADDLSANQLQYAATDAFASWLVYEVLKGLPDAEDK